MEDQKLRRDLDETANHLSSGFKSTIILNVFTVQVADCLCDLSKFFVRSLQPSIRSHASHCGCSSAGVLIMLVDEQPDAHVVEANEMQVPPTACSRRLLALSWGQEIVQSHGRRSLTLNIAQPEIPTAMA